MLLLPVQYFSHRIAYNLAARMVLTCWFGMTVTHTGTQDKFRALEFWRSTTKPCALALCVGSCFCSNSFVLTMVLPLVYSTLEWRRWQQASFIVFSPQEVTPPPKLHMMCQIVLQEWLDLSALRAVFALQCKHVLLINVLSCLWSMCWYHGVLGALKGAE